MSKNRENVIWQSSDGTWNRGFFDFVVTGPDDEWDVNYDHDRFYWVATGLRSEDAARDAWDGANPGGYSRVPWSAKDRAKISRYEKMAAAKAKEDRPSRTSRKSSAEITRDINAILAKKKPYSW